MVLSNKNTLKMEIFLTMLPFFNIYLKFEDKSVRFGYIFIVFLKIISFLDFYLILPIYRSFRFNGLNEFPLLYKKIRSIEIYIFINYQLLIQWVYI